MNVVECRPRIVRSHRLLGRASGLAVAVGLLVAACSPGQTAATGTPAAHATAKPSSSVSPSAGSAADCDSVATCYTPQQLEVAYGVAPLLRRGIDGSGETVVLPELAETQLNPPEVTDLRQDFAAYDRLFHLPAPRLKVVSTFPGPTHPWLAFGEEVLDAEVVHAIAPRAALTVVLVTGTSLDGADQAVAASVAALRLGASEGGIISLSPAGQIGGGALRRRRPAHPAECRAPSRCRPPRDRRRRHRRHRRGGRAVRPHRRPRRQHERLHPRKEVILVASDPLVLSAGGTTLDASHTTGAWIGETAWGLPDGSPASAFQASGGGFSQLFPRPSYQNDVPGHRSNAWHP